MHCALFSGKDFFYLCIGLKDMFEQNFTMNNIEYHLNILRKDWSIKQIVNDSPLQELHNYISFLLKLKFHWLLFLILIKKIWTEELPN